MQNEFHLTTDIKHYQLVKQGIYIDLSSCFSKVRIRVGYESFEQPNFYHTLSELVEIIQPEKL
jgi:hypothetical protein